MEKNTNGQSSFGKGMRAVTPAMTRLSCSVFKSKLSNGNLRCDKMEASPEQIKMTIRGGSEGAMLEVSIYQ